MAGTGARKRNSLVMLGLVALVIVCAIYVSFRVRQARSGAEAGRPPAGASLSIFVTAELAGFREPYS